MQAWPYSWAFTCLGPESARDVMGHVSHGSLSEGVVQVFQAPAVVINESCPSCPSTRSLSDEGYTVGGAAETWKARFLLHDGKKELKPSLIWPT